MTMLIDYSKYLFCKLNSKNITSLEIYIIVTQYFSFNVLLLSLINLTKKIILKMNLKNEIKIVVILF